VWASYHSLHLKHLHDVLVHSVIHQTHVLP